MKVALVGLAFCIAATYACRDEWPNCRTMECRSMPGWMRGACKKTCNDCDQPTLPPRTWRPPKTPPPHTTQGPPQPTFGPSGQCGRSSVQQTRIVNGYDAKPGAWPWIASLQKAGFHFCGGSLIAPNWVLTAAHCVGGMMNTYLGPFAVVLGAHDRKMFTGSEQSIGIKRVIRHPRWSRSGIRNDFALLELVSPAKLNKRVELACLPKPGVRPAIGRTDCYHAGWGMTTYPQTTRKTILQQSMMPVVTVDKCVHNKEVVCAGFGEIKKANACRGDSGGPYMCRNQDGSWELEGVASYVVTYCKYYTGFAPVMDHVDWIRKNIS